MEEEHKEEKQSESIKLIKNTKGYNWEIKLLEINIERLKKINEEMVKLYERRLEDE